MFISELRVQRYCFFLIYPNLFALFLIQPVILSIFLDLHELSAFMSVHLRYQPFAFVINTSMWCSCHGKAAPHVLPMSCISGINVAKMWYFGINHSSFSGKYCIFAYAGKLWHESVSLPRGDRENDIRVESWQHLRPCQQSSEQERKRERKKKKKRKIRKRRKERFHCIFIIV